jgi:hypothetical protein
VADLGSTSPSVRSAACSAASIASWSSGLTVTWEPAASCSRETSESARNRLHAASSSASQTRSTATARPSRAGSVTTTRAVVPSAPNAGGWLDAKKDGAGYRP